MPDTVVLLETIREQEQKRYSFLERKTNTVCLLPTTTYARRTRTVRTGTERVFANSKFMNIAAPVFIGVVFIAILLVMFREMPLSFILGSVAVAVLVTVLLTWFFARQETFRMLVNAEEIRFRKEYYRWQDVQEVALMYLEDNGSYYRPFLILIFHDQRYTLLDLWAYKGSESLENIAAYINAYRALAANGAGPGS